MKKLLLATLVLSFTTQSFALDIVTSPIQLLTRPCSNYLRYKVSYAFCYTQKLNWAASGANKYGEDLGLLAYLVMLPFMLLDEKGVPTLNEQSLMDQGYTEEEIQRYKSDIELVGNEAQVEQITSQEAAISLINRLKSEDKLAEVSLEIMGL